MKKESGSKEDGRAADDCWYLRWMYHSGTGTTARSWNKYERETAVEKVAVFFLSASIFDCNKASNCQLICRRQLKSHVKRSFFATAGSIMRGGVVVDRSMHYWFCRFPEQSDTSWHHGSPLRRRFHSSLHKTRRTSTCVVKNGTAWPRKTSFRQSRKKKRTASMMIHHTNVVLEYKENDIWCLCTTYRSAAILFDEEEDGDKKYASPPWTDDGTGLADSLKLSIVLWLLIISVGLRSIQHISCFLFGNLWDCLWKRHRTAAASWEFCKILSDVQVIYFAL